jgi:hypothetical protein
MKQWSSTCSMYTSNGCSSRAPIAEQVYGETGGSLSLSSRGKYWRATDNPGSTNLGDEAYMALTNVLLLMT